MLATEQALDAAWEASADALWLVTTMRLRNARGDVLGEASVKPIERGSRRVLLRVDDLDITADASIAARAEFCDADGVVVYGCSAGTDSSDGVRLTSDRMHCGASLRFADPVVISRPRY